MHTAALSLVHRIIVVIETNIITEALQQSTDTHLSLSTSLTGRENKHETEAHISTLHSNIHTQMVKINKETNLSSSMENQKINKKKIIFIADQQERFIQRILQKFLREERQKPRRNSIWSYKLFKYHDKY